MATKGLQKLKKQTELLFCITMFATAINYINYPENTERNQPVLIETVCRLRSLVSDNAGLSDLDYLRLINIGKMTATHCCQKKHTDKVDKVCSVLGSEVCDRYKEHYIITRVVFGDDVLYSLFRKYNTVGIVNEPEDCVH